MRTWLITGGAGFIGSHLCDALLERGDQVRIFDTSEHSSCPRQARVIVGDITDESALYRAMDGTDGCFHLAAIASVQQCDLYPVRTNRVNVGGTISVLRAAGELDLPVVYASSGAVYGDLHSLPAREDDECRPLSSYGADKLRCEMEAEIASADHGLHTVGLRFFNVYGPRQNPNSPYSGVISIFCDRIADGRDIYIYGDGGQSRDFVFVGDIVQGLLSAMAKLPEQRQVFNVATGIGTTITELAELIGDLMGKQPRLHYNPARAREIRHSRGSPALARSILRLPEPTPLRSGLTALLASQGRALQPAEGLAR